MASKGRRRERVHVIGMDGAFLVKQLQRLPGSVLKVISRNEAYEPWPRRVEDMGKGSDIAIIGRVVWACWRY